MKHYTDLSKDMVLKNRLSHRRKPASPEKPFLNIDKHSNRILFSNELQVSFEDNQFNEHQNNSSFLLDLLMIRRVV